MSIISKKAILESFNIAVNQLPNFPSNLQNRTIKEGDKVVSYGPHDEHRVAQEQELLGIMRTAIIADAVKANNLKGSDLEKLILKLVEQPNAGETGKENIENVIGRVHKLYLPSDTKTGIGRFLRKDTENFPELANLSKELLDFPSAQELMYKNENSKLVRTNQQLAEKNYQLDAETGTLHSISHERQYVKEQKLNDLVSNFNEHSTELDQKVKFYDAYFKELAAKGAFKDQNHINIMDIGVENGLLTAEIAKSALKHFPDKKINLVAVERTKNFLDEANKNIDPITTISRLNYTPVVHHVGGGVSNDIMQAVNKTGKFDIVLASDVYNFGLEKLNNEIANYTGKNSVVVMKHSNANDFQQEVKSEIKGAIRFMTDKASELEDGFRKNDITAQAGEIKAAMRGISPFTEEERNAILQIKKADYLDQPFQKGSESHDKLRLLEFIAGAPIAAFDHQTRKDAIESFNKQFSNNVAFTASTVHQYPVHEKAIAPEFKEAFSKAIAELNKFSDKAKTTWEITK